MLMMMTNVFISLNRKITASLNGNMVQRLVKLLRVEMGKEIE
jgi:hypothetical protein